MEQPKPAPEKKKARKVDEAPAPAPPPFAPRRATAQVQGIEVNGPLSTSAVSRMLGRAQRDLARCYETAASRARRHDTNAVSARFTIDEMGATRAVQVGRHSLPGLSGCAATALKRLRSARRPDTGQAKVSLKLKFALR